MSEIFVRKLISKEATEFAHKHSQTYYLLNRIIDIALENRFIDVVAVMSWKDTNLGKYQFHREKIKLQKLGLIEIIPTSKDRKGKKREDLTSILRPVNSFLFSCVFFDRNQSTEEKIEIPQPKKVDRNQYRNQSSVHSTEEKIEKPRVMPQPIPQPHLKQQDVKQEKTTTRQEDVVVVSFLDEIPGLSPFLKNRLPREYTHEKLQQHVAYTLNQHPDDYASFFLESLKKDYDVSKLRIPKKHIDTLCKQLDAEGVIYQRTKYYFQVDEHNKIPYDIDFKSFINLVNQCIEKKYATM